MTDATFRNGDTVTFRDGTVATFGHATSTHTDTNDRTVIREQLLRMPPGVKPTYPVEIDWTHQATRTLTSFYLMTSQTYPSPSDGSSFFGRYIGPTTDLCKKYNLHGYFVTDIPEATPEGVYFDGTDKIYNMSSSLQPSNGAQSTTRWMVCKIKADSFSGDQWFIGHTAYFGSSLTDYGLGIGHDGTNLLAVGASAANGKYLSYAWSETGGWHTIAAKFASSGGLWIDGVKVASGDTSHGWGYYFSIGAGVSTSESIEVANATAHYQCAMIGHGDISDADLRALTLDPYQLLRPHAPSSQIITPATTDNDRVWLL